MNKTNIAVIVLLVVGLMQMSGDLIERCGAKQPGKLMRGIGAATMASPAPKVFSSVHTPEGSLETYSTRFFLFWTDREGRKQELELTPEVYHRLKGPYNRRNVYGAVLAYGPVLPADLRDPVMAYALCGERPLLRELGIDPAEVRDPVGVRYEPRPGTDMGNLRHKLEAPCP